MTMGADRQDIVAWSIIVSHTYQITGICWLSPLYDVQAILYDQDPGLPVNSLASCSGRILYGPPEQSCHNPTGGGLCSVLVLNGFIRLKTHKYFVLKSDHILRVLLVS